MSVTVPFKAISHDGNHTLVLPTRENYRSRVEYKPIAAKAGTLRTPMTESYKIPLQRLLAEEEMLENYLQDHDLTTKKIDNCGNCLFQSVLDQIIGDGGSGHKTFRARVCDWMEKNQLYISNFFDASNETLQQHIKRMKQNGTYGDNLEIYTMSVLLQREIHIFKIRGEEEPIQVISPIDDHRDVFYPLGRAVQISHHLNNHYNSILLRKWMVSLIRSPKK